MKCEIKYIVHESTKELKSTTLKELLIILPISIIVVLCWNWCIGVKFLWIPLFIAVCLFIYISFVDAIGHCKSEKE